MLSEVLKTLFTAMLPVLEIRGAIPVGVAAGLDPWLALSLITNSETTRQAETTQSALSFKKNNRDFI